MLKSLPYTPACHPLCKPELVVDDSVPSFHYFHAQLTNVAPHAGKAPFLMSAYLRDADRSGLDTTTPAYSYIEEFVNEPSWQRVDPSDSLP